MFSLRNRHFAVLGVVLLFVLLFGFHAKSLSWSGNDNLSFLAPPLGHTNAVRPDIPPTGLRETILPPSASVHGFNVIDNLYMRRGTLYIVTSTPSSFPEREAFLSRPLDMDADVDVSPTDSELRYITPSDAQTLLGDNVIKVGGLTVLIYDTQQFMTHYYHWWGEVILGLWRVCSMLTDNGAPSFPDRFIMPFVEKDRWRDPAGVDGPLMRAAFPSASIEQAEYWDDFIDLDETVQFERVMLVNRWSAHKHPLSAKWFKMVAGTMGIAAAHDFWKPVRENVVKHLLGYIPSFSPKGIIIAPSAAISQKPIVTYISRQSTGRRLVEVDHAALVTELQKLDDEGVCEFHLAIMERLSLKEQISLVGRSTIIVGVHGNGLTHQLWMPPSPLSATIEIFIPNGYTFDYEMLARNVGHKHYAIWNDTSITYPTGTFHEKVNFPEGFHSNEIPVYGPTVADIIKQRLTATPT